jgi:uncharacterized protein YmfQ (DUF2313 family)
MSLAEKLLQFTKQLYPSGSAFRVNENSFKHRLHRALVVSEAKAFNDAKSILDSMLPDNDNFTASDATAWERRLGLITNESVPLADRKLAIKSKMNHPGTIPARSSARFLEKQLQDAGFDVYVHENRFWNGSEYETQSPYDVTGSFPPYMFQHGGFQHGNAQHGASVWNIIANYIDEDYDFDFNIGADLTYTFFVGGAVVGDYADVPIARKKEFRQLILRTKPVQTIGYLFINYI